MKTLKTFEFMIMCFLWILVTVFLQDFILHICVIEFYVRKCFLMNTETDMNGWTLLNTIDTS